MVDSLRQQTKAALSDDSTASLDFDDFDLQLLPAQIVLIKCEVLWCKGTEKAIRQQASSQTALLSWMDHHKLMMTGHCALVGKSVDRLQRLKLSALLTIEVHHNDVISRLYHKNVHDTDSFDWLMCFRYYWLSDSQCQIRQIASAFLHTFEYWGASSRLVVTALTEKCYMTLTSALHLLFGGAPFGPAGTGKTETTKDLAKSLGRQCIIFNCGVGLRTLILRLEANPSIFQCGHPIR
jgi:dynein heavy chain